MDLRFYEWAKSNEGSLKNIGITVEIPDLTRDNAEKGLQNPCQTVYFDSNVFYGKVCVWKDGQMDTEILCTDTEEIIDYKYYEKIDIKANFDELLKDFLAKMVSFSE